MESSLVSSELKSSANPLRIAIQGVLASFHDFAARKFFANRTMDLVQCSSFPILCKALQDGTADFAVMAIENSIAGSILPNYSLLESNQFKIIGEIYLRIEMNLMALPGQTMEDIRFIQSHPMALLQCEDFFLKYPHIKILEGSDTAESAKNLRDKNLTSYAAVASRLAAETYGLEILKESIESNKQNYTRFLVICRKCDHNPIELANKASVRFETAHAPGSLVQILDIFYRNSINMTKVQSVVIPGRPYEYSFHVDLEWQDQSNYNQAFKELKNKALNLIHFGTYLRGSL